MAQANKYGAAGKLLGGKRLGFRRGRRARKLRQGDFPTSQQLTAELKREQYRHRYVSVVRSTVGVLLCTTAAAILVAVLCLPVLRIYGSSMTPTVSEGNIVVCIKGAELEAGDICSFYYQSNVLVKRVIATAGDWVNIDGDGNVYVNGILLDEPYLAEGEKAYGTVSQTFPLQVPEGRIFVMGDHRATSVDSRTTEVGCIAEENLVGKIVFRIWPLREAGFLS